MGTKHEEKLGAFGLALGFAATFILVLSLGALGVLSAFFAALGVGHFTDDLVIIEFFVIIMLLFYHIPRRWIFGTGL